MKSQRLSRETFGAWEGGSSGFRDEVPRAWLESHQPSIKTENHKTETCKTENF